jgi:YD repeat-containing protein
VRNQNRIMTLWLSIFLLAATVAAGTAVAETITHTYDNLNRLALVKYDNGQEVKYTHDEAGNILTVTSQAPQASTASSSESGAPPPQANRN